MPSPVYQPVARYREPNHCCHPKLLPPYFVAAPYVATLYCCHHILLPPYCHPIYNNLKKRKKERGMGMGWQHMATFVATPCSVTRNCEVSCGKEPYKNGALCNKNQGNTESLYMRHIESLYVTHIESLYMRHIDSLRMRHIESTWDI